MAAEADRAAFARASASGYGRRRGRNRFVVLAARHALGGAGGRDDQCRHGGDYRLTAGAGAAAKVNSTGSMSDRLKSILLARLPLEPMFLEFGGINCAS